MQTISYILARSRSSTGAPPSGRRNHAAAPSDPAQILEYRHRFAFAVAKPGGKALLIDASNAGDGWVAIDIAVQQKVAFAVEVAGDVLAVDSDDPDNAAAVHHLVEELRRAGHSPVLLASGQPGRFHVFARIAAADERTRLAQRVRDLGLDVRRSIRPPLAPHRLGLQPQLLDPADPETALQALRGTRQNPRALSAHMRRLLEHGDRNGRYRSRSEVIQALTLAALNAGWTFERLLMALSDIRNLGGAKVQEIAKHRGPARSRAYVRRSWNRAVARAEASPPFRDRAGARAVIREVERHADAIAWPGKARSTDRVVLQAHLEVAKALGQLTYGASDRSIGERAGVRAATANASHKRLRKRGWLRRIERGVDCRGSTWRLCLPEDQKRNTSPSGMGVCG